MNRLAKTGLGSLALVMVLASMPPSATAQIQIFSTGQYGTPETISLSPTGFGAFGGQYFIPDARTGDIWVVPVTGGPPSAFPHDVVELSVRGGLFFPSGWGDNTGKFLTTGGFVRAYDSAGNSTLLDPLQSAFSVPLLAPPSFGPYGGHLFISDQFRGIWRVDPAVGGLTLFKDLTASPFVNDPFGLEFTPPGFGAFGNRLMASHTVAGSVVALESDGTESLFATLPLAVGQFGLRQMLMTPDDYFLETLGIHGPLLLLSVSGSSQGGGTLGALVALDSTGTVVAHLRVGGIDVPKFDPRGMVFTADGHILISDTSDPIYIASASDFIAGPAAETLTALSPAHLWIGLKNSDDQGTQFDLKAELLQERDAGGLGTQALHHRRDAESGPREGGRRLVRPLRARGRDGGDVLALRVSARIGTNPDGSKCAGPGGSHNSAVGLRLYYDSASRASRFDATITPNPSEDLYLHSNGSPCPNGDGQSPGVTARTLDTTAPAASKARCNDSGVVNFAGGNPFSAIGTWSLAPLP